MRRGLAMADVKVRAEAGVIGVGVSDERPRDGAPRIDMEVARGAIEAAIGRNDEVHKRRLKILSYSDGPSERHAPPGADSLQ